jgi:hypothetical protein
MREHSFDDVILAFHDWMQQNKAQVRAMLGLAQTARPAAPSPAHGREERAGVRTPGRA